ncbi:hypothetical protein GCM10009780_20430 [Actinomadura alba]
MGQAEHGSAAGGDGDGHKCEHGYEREYERQYGLDAGYDAGAPKGGPALHRRGFLGLATGSLASAGALGALIGAAPAASAAERPAGGDRSRTVPLGVRRRVRHPHERHEPAGDEPADPRPPGHRRPRPRVRAALR